MYLANPVHQVALGCHGHSWVAGRGGIFPLLTKTVRGHGSCEAA